MNGATAVPCVSTISPPNMAMTMNTGSSQYFLRSSKNAANSRRKEVIGRSELVHEAVGRRAWRLSRDPVAFALYLMLVRSQATNRRPADRTGRPGEQNSHRRFLSARFAATRRRSFGPHRPPPRYSREIFTRVRVLRSWRDRH